MNRRRFVRNLSFGTVAGVASAGSPRGSAAESTPTAAPAPAPGPTPAPAPSTPAKLATTPMVLQAPRPDGFEAVWGVSGLCRGRVEWESDDDRRGEAATDDFGFVPQGAHFLRIRASGLRPGTNYRIRSVTLAADGDREEIGEWKSFRTLDPAAATTRFAVWNDTHANTTTLQALDAATPASDFLVWNGDTCNDWTTEELLVPTLLHPGERDISRGRPLLLTWGNHDVRGRWAFRMPDLIGTPSGRPFYAFRSGPVGAICLHTGEDKPDSHPSFRGRVAFDALRREQTDWLAATLRRPELAQAPYRIVFCHIPLRWTDESEQDYSKTGFDRHSGRSRAAWHEALVSWGAQLIVSGHTHRHAWLPADDKFPYAQLVGGGPQPANATWMEGTADAERLRILVRNLEGQPLHEVTLPRLG